MGQIKFTRKNKQHKFLQMKIKEKCFYKCVMDNEHETNLVLHNKFKLQVDPEHFLSTVTFHLIEQ